MNQIKPMNQTKPILIVGAGPTGLTAAVELSRFGVPIRIVEKLTEPSTTSRALAVQARTLELLEQRGLAQEMLRLGNRGNATTLYGDGKLLGKIHLNEIKSRFNYILLLSQAETERLLREQLTRQGVPIERGTEMIAFSQPEAATHPGQSGGVRAVLRSSAGDLEVVDASYLISAEGAHSTVRPTLGLSFDGRSLDESYALADLHLDGDIPDDELSIFFSPGGFLAVFPLGNHHFRLIATDSQHHAQDDAEPTLEELQRLYDQDAHIPARLRDMTWSSRFRINSRMLHTLQEGRVFFGGDAAHIHSPAGGQGMNTGIQDMIDLSWKLALVWSGRAAPTLLATYGEDRLPVIRSVVSKTETATDAFNSDSPLVHKIITHAAPFLLDKPWIQQLGAALVSEVAANYRASSLSETDHAPGSLQGGDRVPDLDVLVQEGDALRPARLYELLDPSRFTLLTTGAAKIVQEQFAPWGGLIQTHHIGPLTEDAGMSAEFKACFGSAPGLFLVRPDSYLGFAGGGSTDRALLAWLGHWLSEADLKVSAENLHASPMTGAQ